MYQSLFEQFKKFKILVIGDVMIDAYLMGSVSRISPEAPVPVLNVKKREYRLGGAANVALNLKTMGAEPILCSVIGNDDKGRLFISKMQEHNLIDDGIITSANRRTTLKYRLLGNRNQMLRVDEEDDYLLDNQENSAFMKRIMTLLENQKVDAIIFEDYDKGVLSKENIQTIIQIANNKGIIIAADPKKRNFNHYTDINLFKPNLKEFCDALHLAHDNISLDEIEKNIGIYAESKNIDNLLVTLSERGICIFDRLRNTFFYQPANILEVSDVSGAGDTVISIATLCMVAQLPAQTIAIIGNLAGSIVCQFSGIVPVTVQLLEKEMIKQDINLQ